jgi:predicted short-subunit dehydrogenase-like oxidoreductase (DUF2520 family)
MTTVSILGAGKAGRTLGRLLRLAGYTIESVVTAHRRTAEEAARFIGAGRPGTRPSASEINLISVPDGEIERVAGAAEFRRGQVVFHLCGTYSSSILRRARPAAFGSMHPLKSFADPSLAARTFRGTACVYEGERRAARAIRDLIRRIGGVPLRVRPLRKPLYHAAAVFASNYTLVLAEIASELMRAGGIRETWPILTLARGTLDNIERAGFARALTGPIERGDRRTVEIHLRALRRHDPGLARLYADLGRRAARLARSDRPMSALLDRSAR